MYRTVAGHITAFRNTDRLPAIYSAFFRGKSDYVYPAETSSEQVHQSPGANSDVLDVNDYRKAYAFRKTSEIARALFVFKLCSYPLFVKHSLKLMTVGRTVLGRRLYTKLMASTVSGQFVGGETPEQLLQTVTDIRQAGIGPMLFVPIEEDVGSTEYNRALYDENLEALLQCVTMAKQVAPAFPMSQMKITALIPGNLCGTLSTLVLEATKDHAYLDNIIRVLDGGDLDLPGLTLTDRDILYDGLQRVKAIGEHVEKTGVRLLIDAEYTYLNPALRLISVAMMVRYNTQRPLVAYTYQNYLKETFEKFRADVTLVRSRGAGFGAKLVRGAYMDAERKMAAARGYPDPVHDSYEDTGDMYHRSVEYVTDKIRTEPHRYHVMVASHNEDTARYALQQMSVKGIPRDGGSVVFGQIYGMCDSISSAIGQAGYYVFKSIPYGPLDQCLPYLYRRAVENSSVLGATAKERHLLWNALLDRRPGSARRPPRSINT